MTRDTWSLFLLLEKLGFDQRSGRSSSTNSEKRRNDRKTSRRKCIVEGGKGRLVQEINRGEKWDLGHEAGTRKGPGETASTHPYSAPSTPAPSYESVGETDALAIGQISKKQIHVQNWWHEKSPRPIDDDFEWGHFGSNQEPTLFSKTCPRWVEGWLLANEWWLLIVSRKFFSRLWKLIPSLERAALLRHLAAQTVLDLRSAPVHQSLSLSSSNWTLGNFQVFVVPNLQFKIWKASNSHVQ